MSALYVITCNGCTKTAPVFSNLGLREARTANYSAGWRWGGRGIDRCPECYAAFAKREQERRERYGY